MLQVANKKKYTLTYNYVFSNVAAFISPAQSLIILKTVAYCGVNEEGQFVVKLRSKSHANLCNKLL